jgi:hypothetical protein
LERGQAFGHRQIRTHLIKALSAIAGAAAMFTSNISLHTVRGGDQGRSSILRLGVVAGTRANRDSRLVDRNRE